MFKEKKIFWVFLLTVLIGCGPLFTHALNADDGYGTQIETQLKNVTTISPEAGIDPRKSRDFKYHQAKEKLDQEDLVEDVAEEMMAALPETPQVDNFNEYILGPEDKIKITVFGESELSSDYRVGSDGTIAFPLIGDVKVEGLTLRQAEELIKQRLREGYLKKPSVSIEIAESRPFYILGEVRRPGSYNYIAGMNVLQAVAISGGFTYRANRKSVEILRGRSAPSEPMKVSTGEVVKPGDIIFIRERFF